MNGFLVVDKDAGWTSHDVVAKCRRLLGERRVGHAGTLDPGATGVLVLGVGAATRLLRFVSDTDKEYVGEVVLGVTTSTLDDQGEVTGRFDMAGVRLEDVAEAARSLTGEIDQRVPMISAVKVNGERLHRLARTGRSAEQPVRRVKVERLEVGPGPEPGIFSVSVRCSSGTYVRALADDLGARLGGGAHLRRLRRLRVGPYSAETARRLAEIEEAHRGGQPVLREPASGLPFAPVVVGEDDVRAVAHGRPLAPGRLGAAAGPVAVLDDAGNLLAVYEVLAGGAGRPVVVLAGSGAETGSI